MKYVFLVVCLCLHCVQALDTDIEWQLWKSKFSKSYRTLEEEVGEEKDMDETPWCSNLPHPVGQNETCSCLDNPPSRRPKFKTSHSLLNSIEFTEWHQRAPAQFDWREKGVVFPVRTQGELTDPVAYASADAVASFHAIHHGQLYNLSAHECADCCYTSRGFLIGQVFQCVHNISGLCQTEEYKVRNCKDPTCNQVGKVDGGVQVTPGNETALQMAVLITPVVVSIDHRLDSFLLYESGIYSDPFCSRTRLDYALLLVGYGVDASGDEYWICKNCWGVDWGMKGYIYIARNKGNMCGIATDAQYPV